MSGEKFDWAGEAGDKYAAGEWASNDVGDVDRMHERLWAKTGTRLYKEAFQAIKRCYLRTCFPVSHRPTQARSL